LTFNNVAVASIPNFVVSKFTWSLEGSRLDPFAFSIMIRSLSA
jgi:hypothetical protein